MKKLLTAFLLILSLSLAPISAAEAGPATATTTANIGGGCVIEISHGEAYGWGYGYVRPLKTACNGIWTQHVVKDNCVPQTTPSSGGYAMQVNVANIIWIAPPCKGSGNLVQVNLGWGWYTVATFHW